MLIDMLIWYGGIRMQNSELIEKLLHFQWNNTEVLSATYEGTGTFHAPGVESLQHLPPFYRVLLQVRSGDKGLFRVEIWLPEQWNGVFIGTGNGGMAGSIAYWGFGEHLRNGYAVANTDMGTSLGRESGIHNPDVWKDFGWRATHEMTIISKEIIRLFYEKNAEYSYFVGGSTGGQQALSEAQRFPEDYNGIIAGVPANNRTMLHTYFLWNHVHLRTPDGRKLFSVDEIRKITDSVTAFFQQRGYGQTGDNFISLPIVSAEIIDTFLKSLSRQYPSFTQEQLQALRAVYTGPINPRTGERIYNGMPFGSEIYGCGIEECQGQESPHYYPFIWAFGDGYDPYSFDFDLDLEQLNQLLAADLNANQADLSGFQSRGGKLFIYSGSADPCVPFPDAMRYYERVLETMGGYEKVGEFCRYYLLPGRDHGAGGRGVNALRSPDGKDELEILRAWREQGRVPDRLQAIRYRNARPIEGMEFSRDVYPYASEQFPVGVCPPVCADRYLQ